MLIFLFPYKFTDFFYYREDVKFLVKYIKGKIEIHDLGYFINKSWYKKLQAPSTKKIKVKKFKTLNNWKKYFLLLYSRKKKIIIINFIHDHSIKSLILNYFLSKKNVTIIKQFTPGGFDIDLNKKNNINFDKIIKNLFQFKKIFYFIKSRLYRIILSKIKFKNNIILFNGNNRINPYPSSLDKYINFHSYDYSKYLLQKKIKKNNKFIVFLDSSFPNFVSDRNLFGENINFDKLNWYNDINYSLKSLSKKYFAKIVIIPHPKNRHVLNSYYDKDFIVAKNIDASFKLISKAKLVVTCSCTTAISYAVIFKKKLLFLFNNELKDKCNSHYREINSVSKILASPLINMSKKKNIFNFSFKVNKIKYEKYKYDFLTSKKISNKMNYQIISDIYTNLK